MTQPAWLDRQAYPFSSHYINLPHGRVHYVDEGSGDVILMVHGTPTWSFLYRHLIKGLSTTHRVIAPDLLGFGLSDKPADYSYHASAQAATLKDFIQALDLTDITLVLHDFGGPFGLSYAIDHPDNVRHIVLANTWMWSLQDDWQKVVVGRLLGGPIGRFLYHRFNFEVNVIVPAAYGDKSTLTRAIHDQYRHASRDADARQAIWIYTGQLLDGGDWYDSLWQRRDALRDIPALILWGMRDVVFGKKYLERWQTVFDHAQIETLPTTGHFVYEEQGDALVPIIRDRINQTAATAAG